MNFRSQLSAEYKVDIVKLLSDGSQMSVSSQLSAGYQVAIVSLMSDGCQMDFWLLANRCQMDISWLISNWFQTAVKWMSYSSMLNRDHLYILENIYAVNFLEVLMRSYKDTVHFNLRWSPHNGTTTYHSALDCGKKAYSW